MYNYKFTVKYKNPDTVNILTDNYRTGFTMSFEGEINENAERAITELIPVNPSTLYSVAGKPGVTGTAELRVVCFDFDKQPIDFEFNYTDSFTTPSDVFYVVFVMNNTFIGCFSKSNRTTRSSAVPVTPGFPAMLYCVLGVTGMSSVIERSAFSLISPSKLITNPVRLLSVRMFTVSGFLYFSVNLYIGSRNVFVFLYCSALTIGVTPLISAFPDLA